MSRSLLITIVVILVIAILGVGAVLYWKSRGTNDNQNTNTTININTPDTVSTNTNGAGIVADVLNTKVLNTSVTYRGGEIPLDKVDITTAYTGYKAAPEGKKYVVVYLGAGVLHNDVPMFNWIGQEVQLIDSEARVYTYDNAQIGGGLVGGDTQFISFLVEEGASGFSLRFVRDGEDKSVDLGL